MKAYLATVDGMEDWQTDDSMHSFWSAARNLADEGDHPRTHWVLADEMICSFFLYVELSTGHVVWLSSPPIILCQDLSEFATRYLEDPEFYFEILRQTKEHRP